jgi:large subunit ribosomal protein L9
MELLLLEDVTGLGARGEIVSVARGYARNYLIPKKKARIPSEQAICEVRVRTEKLRVEFEAEKADLMAVAKTLSAVSLTIPMKAAEGGHLYGSVGPRQVAELLVAAGHEVDERHVILDPHLKDVGEYDVTIALHAEVQVPVKVQIVAEEEA